MTSTLRQIAPGDLLIDTNVRTDTALDKPFQASIKAHGVLVPIVGIEDEDGRVHVRSGQRRTLAAREADAEDAFQAEKRTPVGQID